MRLLRLFLLVCAIVVLHTKAEFEVPIKIKCDGIEVRGNYHKKEVLTDGLNRPYQLAYDKHERELFFSHNVGNDTEDRFEIRYLSHNSTISKPIEEKVRNGFALAFDEHKRTIYFGGSNGIFKRWLDTGKSVKLIGKHNIWDMFLKNHLYFITYPAQKLYKLIENEKGTTEKGHKKKVSKTEEIKTEQIKLIEERVFQFAIDGEDDIFITNSTGLYMIHNSTRHPILMEGESVFRAMEINNKGEAHFAGKNAIYVPHKHNHTLYKIADVKNIFGLTFDEDDHIIYSNPLAIVKLVPDECTEFVPIPIPT